MHSFGGHAHCSAMDGVLLRWPISSQSTTTVAVGGHLVLSTKIRVDIRVLSWFAWTPARMVRCKERSVPLVDSVLLHTETHGQDQLLESACQEYSLFLSVGTTRCPLTPMLV